MTAILGFLQLAAYLAFAGVVTTGVALVFHALMGV